MVLLFPIQLAGCHRLVGNGAGSHDLSAAELLLAYGASPNLQNGCGDTAPHLRAQDHDADMLGLLLGCGADFLLDNNMGQCWFTLTRTQEQPAFATDGKVWNGVTSYRKCCRKYRRFHTTRFSKVCLHGISTGKACAHSPRCLWRICSKLLMSQLHHCSQLAAIRRHSGARLVLACCQSLRSNQMFVVGLWQLRSLY